jgi:hypothetical protein
VPEKSGIDAVLRLASCVNAAEEMRIAVAAVATMNLRMIKFLP